MMTSCLNWLGRWVGMIAVTAVKFRWLGSMLETNAYARVQKRANAIRSTGGSRYGAWLTETVTYHH